MSTNLRWILLSDLQPQTSLYKLSSEKNNHLRKVLRMEWDEDVYLTDGRGHLFAAKLIKTEQGASFQIHHKIRSEAEPKNKIELVICLPKNSTMDWVIEKATECDVHCITPVMSSRSVVRLKTQMSNNTESNKHHTRWQHILEGAVEQSERLWKPILHEPMDWSQWIKSAEKNEHSFAFISENRNADITQTWHALQNTNGDPHIRIIIGPEGGFSDAERENLHDIGFKELTLGSTVLRVETAVIAALTLARFASAATKT